MAQVSINFYSGTTSLAEFPFKRYLIFLPFLPKFLFKNYCQIIYVLHNSVQLKKGVETCSSDRSLNHKIAAGNMYLILKKCLQNMIYFTNKEIFSRNDPLNFMEKKGCYDFF
jgi:hypothetical protein